MEGVLTIEDTDGLNVDLATGEQVGPDLLRHTTGPQWGASRNSKNCREEGMSRNMWPDE